VDSRILHSEFPMIRFMPEKTNFEILVLFLGDTTFLEFVSYILLSPVIIITVLYVFYKMYQNRRVT
jgi:hypothetical protein